MLRTIARSTLKALHIDITRNMRYDRMASRIFQKCITPGTNCIDIGAHKGEMLAEFLKLSPSGHHFAFEPIPVMYKELARRYSQKAQVYPYALAAQSGKATFNYVRNAPAYSGLRKRQYAVASPDIEEIQVEVRTLDELIPSNLAIGLIKIDVEGAEYEVISGGIDTISRNKPYLLFEFGKGASDYYGTDPGEFFDLFTETLGMRVRSLPAFLSNGPAYTREGFIHCYDSITEYYFIAAPH